MPLRAYDGTYACCANCFYHVITHSCHSYRFVGTYRCKRWKDGTVPQQTLSSFMGGGEVKTRPADNEQVENMSDTIRAKVLAEISDEYKEVWNRLSFIKDDYARVRATNMVLMSDDLPSRDLPPEVQQAVAERKEAQELEHRRDSFDFQKGQWNHCPECGTKDIDKTSKGGKPYKACGTNGIYLNDNGEVNPMPREAEKGKKPYRVKPDWTTELLEAK